MEAQPWFLWNIKQSLHPGSLEIAWLSAAGQAIHYAVWTCGIAVLGFFFFKVIFPSPLIPFRALAGTLAGGKKRLLFTSHQSKCA